MSSRLAIFTDEAFLGHETGCEHPERAERITAIRLALEESTLADRLEWRRARPAAAVDLLRCHTEEHVVRVRGTSGRIGALDADTVYSAETWKAATIAAGSVASAARACFLRPGELEAAFCLVRPPGHHATRNAAMGFCFLNNVAVAARHLQSIGCQKVLIIDWDVHHGNGTQDIFYDDPTVFYYSLHLHPHYPGTGMEWETGEGKGRGTTLNRPLPRGFPADRYREMFERDLDTIVTGFRPDFAVVSCGFDSHRLDPLGGLQLEDEDFAFLTHAVVSRMPRGRVISALEGGYNLGVLGSAAVAHASALLVSRVPH